MSMFAAAAISCALLLARGVAGFYIGRDASSVRQDVPALDSARRLVEELCKQQLPNSMSEAEFLKLHADRFCTRRLKELLVKDHWKGQGFFEGYKQGQPDPLRGLKPPFANGGWFVTEGPADCAREATILSGTRRNYLYPELSCAWAENVIEPVLLHT